MVRESAIGIGEHLVVSLWKCRRYWSMLYGKGNWIALPQDAAKSPKCISVIALLEYLPFLGLFTSPMGPWFPALSRPGDRYLGTCNSALSDLGGTRRFRGQTADDILPRWWSTTHGSHDAQIGPQRWHTYSEDIAFISTDWWFSAQNWPEYVSNLMFWKFRREFPKAIPFTNDPPIKH